MNINVVEKINDTPFSKVYIGEVCDTVSLGEIYPEQRWKEIETTRNVKTRQHNFSAGKLLMKVLDDLGIDIKDINVRKTEFGKWVCDGLYFFYKLQ